MSTTVADKSGRVAWAAGIFEGEGCGTEVGSRFAVNVKNTDEWVIRRFDEACSCVPPGFRSVG
jgi:hypothetical protein